jgi:hypothetical protein
MFRMLKLKPPHGWNAVAWELAIVTVGVLMALALQQWAENLASQSRTTRAREAIRQELRDHYLNALEWRIFAPCITAQLDRIESQISSSASVLHPIEARRLDKIRVAVMAPGRLYDDSAWRAAISEGTAFQLTDLERRQLTNEHWLAASMDKSGHEWADADEDLLAATRPIEIDPGVKLALLHSVDRMQAVGGRMNDWAAEMMFWVENFGAAPSRAEAQSDLERNSVEMYQFCKAQHLAVRDLATALNPNS